MAIGELFQKLVKDVAMFDDPNTGALAAVTLGVAHWGRKDSSR